MWPKYHILFITGALTVFVTKSAMINNINMFMWFCIFDDFYCYLYCIHVCRLLQQWCNFSEGLINVCITVFFSQGFKKTLNGKLDLLVVANWYTSLFNTEKNWITTDSKKRWVAENCTEKPFSTGCARLRPKSLIYIFIFISPKNQTAPPHVVKKRKDVDVC